MYRSHAKRDSQDEYDSQQWTERTADGACGVAIAVLGCSACIKWSTMGTGAVQ